MSATGLDVFNRTVHVANTWLDEIMETLGPDRQVAWHALGGVLRTVRDRLPLGLAAHLGAQLPLIVRGAYYDRWQPEQGPRKWRSLDEFLALLSEEFRTLHPVNTKEAAGAVFQVLNHFLDPGQVRKVREALPEEVRRLWPEAKPIAA